MLTTNRTFTSAIKLLNTFEASDNVKNEPMFFNSDFNFAMERGGEITKAFLNALPDDWKNAPLVFDSRIHMLMSGWFPCIPGFHHDDVPRSKNGQPNYDNPEYHSEHIMALVNAEVCPTKFVIGNCPVSAVEDNEVIYKKWHDDVQDLVNKKKVQVIDCPNKQLMYFDWNTFHTGEKAVKNGWRWFGRVTRNSERVNNITNEIRNQVQVYLEFPTAGW